MSATRSARGVLILAAIACATQAAYAAPYEPPKIRRALWRPNVSPRRELSSQLPTSDNERRGMGWVVSNFPLKTQLSCDATWYHSSLLVNVSRPSLSTFCFQVSARNATDKYSCDNTPYPGQVTTVQVLAADASCADAVSSVTLDGKPWPHYSFDPASHVLTIQSLNTALPPDVDHISNRAVCVALQPYHPTCSSLPAFCGPTYGPEPACGILIADSRGSCCPVFRAGFGSSAIRTPVSFIFGARLTGRTYGCDQVTSDPAVAADLTGRIAAQYGKALGGLDPDNFEFVSYQCRGSRFGAILQVTGLTANAPELILSTSASLLKPVATQIGLVGIRARPYVKGSPRSPPPGTEDQEDSPVAPPLAPLPPFPLIPGHPVAPRSPALEPPVYGPAQPPVYGTPPSYGDDLR